MSVINQMLKDLEQRAPEQGQAPIPVVSQQKPSIIKIVLISLIVFVILTGVGFYIWNLQQQIAANELAIKEPVASSVVTASSGLVKETVNAITPNSKVIIEQKITQKVPEINGKPLPEVKAESNLALQTSQQATQQSVQQSISKEKVNMTQPTSKESKRPIVLAQPEPTKTEPVVSALTQAPTTSKMSVSRRKLTAKELVAQKLTRAEKAIKNNDVMKAEQLFEDVLIVEPNNKQARKKLAALWFGRKSYQQATNLLSQGISLDSNDAELRLLKARVHLQQEQVKAAYNTLTPLATLKNQEYQVMLANVSQQTEHYETAIQAYKTLINMQAYSGRWHLGLAIVYDKTSQFPLAVAEYALAITKSDLSIASAKFAQQRMQALGE